MRLTWATLRPRARRALHAAAALRVPVALVAAVACLAAGVSLPILRVNKLLVFSEPFSILDGVHALVEDDDWFIAGLIVAFSIAFPLLKVGTLFVLWWRRRRGDAPSPRSLAALQALGKWSMLDVFVVALTIFAIKARAFADANVAVAIYPFVVAIALTAYSGHALNTAGTDHRSRR